MDERVIEDDTEGGTPCPFCRETEALSLYYDDVNEYYYIMCMCCFATGPHLSSKNRAVLSWNNGFNSDHSIAKNSRN